MDWCRTLSRQFRLQLLQLAHTYATLRSPPLVPNLLVRAFLTNVPHLKFATEKRGSENPFTPFYPFPLSVRVGNHRLELSNEIDKRAVKWLPSYPSWPLANKRRQETRGRQG